METRPFSPPLLGPGNEANTSPDIQNEMIKVMGLQVLRNVSADLQDSPFLMVMVDETTDSSNREQVTLILWRY